MYLFGEIQEVVWRLTIARGGDGSAKMGVLINIHKDPSRKM